MNSFSKILPSPPCVSLFPSLRQTRRPQAEVVSIVFQPILERQRRPARQGAEAEPLADVRAIYRRQGRMEYVTLLGEFTPGRKHYESLDEVGDARRKVWG